MGHMAPFYRHDVYRQLLRWLQPRSRIKSLIKAGSGAVAATRPCCAPGLALAQPIPACCFTHAAWPPALRRPTCASAACTTALHAFAARLHQVNAFVHYMVRFCAPKESPDVRLHHVNVAVCTTLSPGTELQNPVCWRGSGADALPAKG